MGNKRKLLQKWLAAVLAAGIILPSTVRIHAEEESTPQPGETPVTESVSSPSPEPTASSTPSPAPTAVSPAPSPVTTPAPTPSPSPKPTPVPGDPHAGSSQGALAVNVYRLYNLANGNHMYTADVSERNRLKQLGWKDEGIGWVSPDRGEPVYRLYNPAKGDHFFTVSKHERDVLGTKGWKTEGIGWYSDTQKRVSVDRIYNPRSGKHHDTANAGEVNALLHQGWRREGTAFYAMKGGTAPKPAPKDPNDKPSNGAAACNLYRLYNQNNQEHIYTASTSERDRLRAGGWIYEGTGWVSPSAGKPVYRLYNPKSGEHFYTMSAHERDVLGLKGWRKEGTGFYSDTLHRVSIYRVYNPRTGKHHYTSSANERNTLLRQGWRNEKIAFYAMKPGWQRTFTHGPVPYYSQLDPRWANLRYGGQTIRNTGCGVTGIAMVVTSLTGRSVYPPEIASYLYARGQYNVTSAGTTGTARLVAAARYGLKVDKITSKAQLETALRQGKVISEMTEASFANTSHGVVVFGDHNGSTTVYDPYNSRHNGSYSIDYMWRARAFSPDNYDAGAVLFAFYKN